MPIVIKVLRIDAGCGALRPPERTPQGFLRVDGYVGRPGIYEYKNTEQDVIDFAKINVKLDVGAKRLELRPEEEVFSPTALAGYEGAPLTAYHPKTKVTPSNVRALEVGTSTSVARKDGDGMGARVAASMVVKDQRTIAKVESGELQELSPGYDSALDVVRGPDGRPVGGFDKRYATRTNPLGRYDMVQRDITINHLALVPHARGGSDMRVRMDEADYSVGSAETDDDDAPDLVVLTTATDGHQHTLDPVDASGCTSYATADGADTAHKHEWVRTADGKVVIGENAGHTHEVDPATVGFREDAAPDPKAPPAPVTSFRRDAAAGGPIMEAEEQIRALKAQLADAERSAEEHKTALTQAVSRADAAEAQIVTITEERDLVVQQLQAGHTAMETEAIKEHATRADAAEAKVKEVEKSTSERIMERCSILVGAKMVLGDAFRLDQAEHNTNREIQATVIKHLSPRDDVGSSVSDAFIASRFDSLIEARKRTARSYQSASQVLSDKHVRTDSADTETRTTSAERQKQWRDQWRKPLPSSQLAKKEA